MYLRIPKERIGALIGPCGSVKREIEKKTETELVIDSETGEVRVDGKENPLGVLKARDVVRAIGRGFSPEKAMRLIREDQYLDIIDIKDYAGESERAMRRLRGRIIGEGGRTREALERTTGANVSVYGKTVAIIGGADELRTARTAVEMLLRGAEHSTVYRFLEHQRKELRSKWIP
jgi:ribosomal RNA assembly protein